MCMHVYFHKGEHVYCYTVYIKEKQTLNSSFSTGKPYKHALLVEFYYIFILAGFLKGKSDQKILQYTYV